LYRNPRRQQAPYRVDIRQWHCLVLAARILGRVVPLLWAHTFAAGGASSVMAFVLAIVSWVVIPAVIVLGVFYFLRARGHLRRRIFV